MEKSNTITETGNQEVSPVVEASALASDVVISVRNVSKKFKLFQTPTQRVKEALHPFRKKYHSDFWAVKDVSFDIKRGETIGIVGRNGSGKSTLLQLICGTLTPTTGEVAVSGRISALLELGAGFNPEFTGRENVFMNGAILGMSRKEIESRFADIADFADIGDFLDQPVKTYSSGMYVRLAFSVAINVDPEILVVDEALSVGDEAFQRKCYSRLEEIRKGGTTILFVSHSASSIVELCNRAMLFDQGNLLLGGSPKLVISKYHKFIYAPADKIEALREEMMLLDSSGELIAKTSHDGGMDEESPEELENPVERAFYDPNMVSKSTLYYEGRNTHIGNTRILTPEGVQVNNLIRGARYVFTYNVRFDETAFSVGFGMLIKTTSGFELGGATTSVGTSIVDCIEAGESYCVEYSFQCLLAPAVYFLNAGTTAIKNGEQVYLHRCIDVEMFRVQEEGITPTLGVSGYVDFSIKPSLKKQLT